MEILDLEKIQGEPGIQKEHLQKKDGAVIVKRRIVSGGNCTIKSIVYNA